MLVAIFRDYDPEKLEIEINGWMNTFDEPIIVKHIFHVVSSADEHIISIWYEDEDVKCE